MIITIDLPVRTYVRKYIQARYGCELWSFDKSDRIGKIFYSLLERSPRRYAKPGPYPKDFKDVLKIQVKERYVNSKGHYLSFDNMMEFNDQIKLELIEEIKEYERKLKNKVGLKKYNELYLKHNSGSRLKTVVVQNPNVWQHFEFREVVYDILGQYGITEDDFPFDTVKKNVQRLKIPLLNAV